MVVGLMAVNTVCGVSYFQTAKYLKVLTGVGHDVHVGVASTTSHIHQYQEIARPHHKHMLTAEGW